MCKESPNTIRLLLDLMNISSVHLSCVYIFYFHSQCLTLYISMDPMEMLLGLQWHQFQLQIEYVFNALTSPYLQSFIA